MCGLQKSVDEFCTRCIVMHTAHARVSVTSPQAETRADNLQCLVPSNFTLHTDFDCGALCATCGYYLSRFRSSLATKCNASVKVSGKSANEHFTFDACFALASIQCTRTRTRCFTLSNEKRKRIDVAFYWYCVLASNDADAFALPRFLCVCAQLRDGKICARIHNATVLNEIVEWLLASPLRRKETNQMVSYTRALYKFVECEPNARHTQSSHTALCLR